MGKPGDVPECAACGVGIDVEIAVGIPGESVVVGTVVVVPCGIVGVGDSVGGLAVGIGVGEVEFDLTVGAGFAVGSGDGEEVLIEDIDLALDEVFGDVAGRSVVRSEDVEDDGDSLEGDGGVVLIERIGIVVGTIVGTLGIHEQVVEGGGTAELVALEEVGEAVVGP